MQVESWTVWTRAWIHILVQRVVQRQRNIIIMDDNYTRNGSNNGNGSKLTDIFWTHAVHTIVHIQNIIMLRNNNDKTPYELWKGSADNNLYIKVTQGNILLIEIYINDIVLKVLVSTRLVKVPSVKRHPQSRRA